MAEVTFDSLQYLNDADVRAMAIYLKSLGQGTPPAPETTAMPPPESSLLLHFGQTVYEAQCASCHAADGRGMPPEYPPLAGNPSIQMQSAVNPIRMVLNGGFPPGTEATRCRTACRPSRRAFPTTKSPPWSPISAPPGAIGATAVSAREANELRTAPLD